MRRLLLLLTVALAVLGHLAGLMPSLAQTTKGKKYALLVGINEYEHSSLAPLRYSENDVEKLAEILQKPSAGFEVRLLTVQRGKKAARDMPTLANIRSALDSILDRVKRHDVVLVALSGHGVQLEVADPEDRGPIKSHPFFCPTDADFRKVSYSTGKAPRLLNLNHLLEDMASSKASSRFVLVDACRNEYRAESATRNADVDRVSIPRGVGVLFSCKSREKAWESSKLEHGVFFHEVLEGLRGEARNKYGEVDWDSLVARVKSEVPRKVRALIGGEATQTPHGITNTEGLSVLVQLGAPRTPPVGKVEWGKEIQSSSTKMKLMRILGKGEKAKFQMGSPESEPDRDEGETQHEVILTRPFWMSKYEVSQGEFKKVMSYNPGHFSRDGKGKEGVDYGKWLPGAGKDVIPEGDDADRYPVENVSWQEAQEFCARLNKLEKDRTYRLPTEAEWEYACRGPGREYQIFHVGDKLSSSQANFDGNNPFGDAARGPYLERPCEVGKYAANAFGLHDMHGNVSEWCADAYDADFYTKSPRTDPENTGKDSRRILRGGGYGDHGRYCRSADRQNEVPTYRNDYLGFRVVVEPAR